MGKQLARPPGAPRPLCVCFTVGACMHPSCNVIAILRAIGAWDKAWAEGRGACNAPLSADGGQKLDSVISP